jgi:GAF domain-containing protein
VRPFTDKQVELVRNFATQAVIAIENTRLFNELRQRTTDLSESLEQQTATSEVLKVISSSQGELEPVFQAMLENAVRICEAKFGTLYLREADVFRAVATHNAPTAYVEDRKRNLVRPPPNSTLGQVLKTHQVTQVADITAVKSYIEGDPYLVSAVKLGGYRTVVAVPMLKDDSLIGVITINRQEVQPFTDKQIALVQNFAAQAVIAIENARLLNELRQRTTDLTESLERQTATSEVLKVISSSPGDLKPVFESILNNATRICEAKFGLLFLVERDAYRTAALHNVPSAYVEARHRRPIVGMSGNSALAQVARTKRAVQVADVAQDPAYQTDSQRLTFVTLTGARTTVAVPMLKDNDLIGTIAIYRQEVRPFTEKQIALLENFAAQAVIAIENARLLNELRKSLQQQTATSEVLSVISSSGGELESVFNSMLKNATGICEAKFGAMYFREGDDFRTVAMHGAPQALVEARLHTLRHPGPNTALGRTVQTKDAIQIEDIAADQAYTERDPQRVAAVELGGVRTLLSVPLLKDDGSSGPSPSIATSFGCSPINRSN